MLVNPLNSKHFILTGTTDPWSAVLPYGLQTCKLFSLTPAHSLITCSLLDSINMVQSVQDYTVGSCKRWEAIQANFPVVVELNHMGMCLTVPPHPPRTRPGVMRSSRVPQLPHIRGPLCRAPAGL